ncbi:MAG TPA: UDP-4-amino-4,6-dideoxy-N-acetyl-beta-L-altrosamine N-acetyltransferase [Sulfurospirillum sp. UBA12182]|nr:MAG TPA: UDP-4-amino-4,6-dideoxy-N-acetyl-beta-L-altrosamine N-acetyltransferase [Sulfurospirillum sp. UBA12182]
MSILTSFTKLPLNKLEMILDWRNNPTIKNNMYTKECITLEEHLKFVKSLQNSTEKKYFLVSNDNFDIGVIYFTSISKLSCYMGIYANPNQKGVGELLMQEIIKYGFNTLSCQAIKAEVYKNNQRAIKLYEAFGFTTISQSKNLLKMELKNENR